MAEKKHQGLSLFNQAVLLQLQLCLRLVEKAGYSVTAAYISSAVDFLQQEALSDAELSQLRLDRDERVRLTLEMFTKHMEMMDKREDSGADNE